MEFDNLSLSNAINKYTSKVITTTEDFIKNADKVETEDDIINIMINGEKASLSEEEYSRLKEEHSNFKLELRESSKKLATQYKDDAKKDVKNVRKYTKKVSNKRNKSIWGKIINGKLVKQIKNWVKR